MHADLLARIAELEAELEEETSVRRKADQWALKYEKRVKILEAERDRLRGALDAVRRVAEWEADYRGRDAKADRIDVGQRVLDKLDEMLAATEGRTDELGAETEAPKEK